MHEQTPSLPLSIQYIPGRSHAQANHVIVFTLIEVKLWESSSLHRNERNVRKIRRMRGKGEGGKYLNRVWIIKIIRVEWGGWWRRE